MLNNIEYVYIIFILYFTLIYRIPQFLHYLINNVVFKFILILCFIQLFKYDKIAALLLIICFLYTVQLDFKQSIREGFIEGLLEGQEGFGGTEGFQDSMEEPQESNEDIDAEIASLENDTQPEIAAHED
jgi:hypothetical protein